MRESRGITVLALVAVSLLGILVWFLSGDGSVPPVSDASTPADPEGPPALSAPPTSGADPAAPERAPDEARASRTHVQTDNLLTGRVVLDGRPLPGVRVEVWRDLLLPTVVHLEDALTDIEGRFSFRGLEDGIHGLLLDGLEVPRGYRLERVIIEDHRDLDLGEIRIPAPGSLSGRVVDPEGQPLAGVQVLDSPGPFPRFDPMIGNIGLALFETVTDGEGRFSFEGVVSGPHQVLAASPDHADRKVPRAHPSRPGRGPIPSRSSCRGRQASRDG